MSPHAAALAALTRTGTVSVDQFVIGGSTDCRSRMGMEPWANALYISSGSGVSPAGQSVKTLDHISSETPVQFSPPWMTR